MASLVLGIAGAAALGPAGLAWGGALGMSGAQIGFTVGSMIGNMMTKLPDVQGPRLGDLKVQSSTYGKSIPIYYGTSRGAGEVMWSSDLIETENEEEAGGKGGPSQSVTSYTYSVNCAVAVCAGEITGIRKIWANGNLIYDQSEGNLGPTGQSSNIRIYTGSETQMPDALEEAYLGVGNVPAYRGLARVVFENLQLEKYGNRIPNFSFEVVANGDITTPTYTHYSDQVILRSEPHPYISGLVISLSADNGTSQPVTLHLVDMISGTDTVFSIGDIPAQYCNYEVTHVLIKDPVTGLIILDEYWIGYDTVYSGYSNVVAIALDTNTMAVKRIIDAGGSGFSFIGNMKFDPSCNYVLFATGSSTVSAGYRYLDPLRIFPAPWWITGGAKNTSANVDWWTGQGATGKLTVALSNFNKSVALFSTGNFFKLITTNIDEPYIAYDSNRERYAWYNGNVASKSTFQTVTEDGLEVTNYSPTNAPIPEFLFYSFHYFPVMDKFVLVDRYSIRIINADTFEQELSKTIVTFPQSLKFAVEIPQLPEYLSLYVNGAGDGNALVPLTDRLGLNTVTLSSIVTDICGRVDLAPGDIDVTDLTDEVEGYTIAQQMTARAAIDGLQAAFYFDAVESD